MMFKTFLHIGVAAALLAFAGISRTWADDKPSPSTIAPATLLVERVIAGSILGVPLKQPYGVATDFRGVVFVCDGGNNRIIRFQTGFIADAETGGYGSTEGSLDRPTFLTVDNGLNLLVSDAGNRRVSRFNTRLNYVDEISFVDNEDPLKYGVPSGTALTDYGAVWVADQERNRIAVFDNVGNFDRFIGDFGYSGGQLSHPEKIIKDHRGEQFVVCDAGNSRLMVYDTYGNFKREISAEGFNYPIAASIDQKDNLWVLDGGTGRIFFLDARGTKLFEIGPLLPGDQKSLNNPSDITLLADGRLLISDTGNNRLVICQVIFPE